MAAIFHPTTRHWLKRQRDDTRLRALHQWSGMPHCQTERCSPSTDQEKFLAPERSVGCWSQWGDSLGWGCLISNWDCQLSACVDGQCECAWSCLCLGLKKIAQNRSTVHTQHSVGLYLSWEKAAVTAPKSTLFQTLNSCSNWARNTKISERRPKKTIKKKD